MRYAVAAGMSKSPVPDASAARPRPRPIYQDLTFQVVVGMALGVAVGALWPQVGKELKPLGDVFIRLIQMVVGLIIFCTVTHGIASVRDLRKVGRIAVKALIYFEVVTSIALVIGLVTINIAAARRGHAYRSRHAAKPRAWKPPPRPSAGASS